MIPDSYQWVKRTAVILSQSSGVYVAFVDILVAADYIDDRIKRDTFKKSK
jgi:hypothetical protein